MKMKFETPKIEIVVLGEDVLTITASTEGFGGVELPLDRFE